jgi:hypothetical protein
VIGYHGCQPVSETFLDQPNQVIIFFAEVIVSLETFSQFDKYVFEGTETGKIMKIRCRSQGEAQY